MALLELQKITKKFGGLTAVDNFDMTVEKGEIVGLIGPNGAGKTTVFNMISGVYNPTGGKVIFNGEDITGFNPHLVARRGLVRTFQVTTIFSDLTVLENIRQGLDNEQEPVLAFAHISHLYRTGASIYITYIYR